MPTLGDLGEKKQQLASIETGWANGMVIVYGFSVGRRRISLQEAGTIYQGEDLAKKLVKKLG